MSTLDAFSPAARAWFARAFAAPTPAQEGAWEAAASGDHALVVAPTGSGKTLAAFLWAIDAMLTGPLPEPEHRLRVVYVSPLKALAADVQRNLRSPLVGIGAEAARLGEQVHEVRVGVRTGDTPASERRSMVARPPDVLITTPESLYLMLTSQARRIFSRAETVIVDEVHAVAATKRGAHLALTLERLDELAQRPLQRIGLSATVRPPRAVATYLVGHRPLAEGGRPVRLVTPGGGPSLTLDLVSPVADLTDPAATPTREDERRAAALVPPDLGADFTPRSWDAAWAPGPSAAQSPPPAPQEPQRAPSVWPAITDKVVDLVTAHRSTIVFTSSRRTAERLTARVNAEWQARLAEARTTRDEAGHDPGDDAPAGAHVLAPPQRGDLRNPDVPGGLPAQIMAQSDLLVPTTEVLARAHHGSMSREERTTTEDALKRGELRAVVATSSLELGIDMGAVDLVIQIGAPTSVASALQRIGRAGHQVGATSHSVWLPTHRGELLSSLTVAELAAQGRIEEVRVPANPLDVLAQQVVAIVAGGDTPVQDLGRLVRRAAPFHALGEDVFVGVLDMLTGRYPSEDFADLRPRLVWDRATGVLSARPGAARLAVTSGGTIPDRGMFGVFLARPGEGSSGGSSSGDNSSGDGGGAAGAEAAVVHATRGAGRRVGELDEEMVYESRVGDVFTLGTSTWRVEAITPDRVLVSPAPGAASRLPFWRGDAQGRPAELGAAVGTRARELAAGENVPDASDGTRAFGERASVAVDGALAENLRRFLSEQEAATGHLPDDRTIVLERFRDELGDWRLVLHSPIGGRVLAPWALVLGARLRARTGMDVQVAAANDGIVWRMPETGDPFSGVSAAALAGPVHEALTAGGAAGAADIGIEDLLIEPSEVGPAVVEALAGSAHLAARFREAAARSLLLPRRNPGRRQPLWQQRHRAAQLFAVASRHEDFPVLLEAVRESLREDYDVPALTDLMRRIGDGSVQVLDVTTEQPSPFARSLLTGYTASFLYNEDAPAAERRASALALSPALLAELVGAELGDLADLLEPDAVAQVAAQVGLRTHPATDAEAVWDLVRRLGPLPMAEVASRVRAPGSDPQTVLGEGGDDETDELERQLAREAATRWVGELVAARRLMLLRVAGREQYAVLEDAARLRDALGVALPPGLPEAVLEPPADPLGDLVRRHARTHGPFTAAALAERFGLGVGALLPTLDGLVRDGTLTRGRITPGVAPGTSDADEYVDAEVLRRLRRRSLAHLRKEIEAVPSAALAAHLARWQHVAAHGTSPELRGEGGVLSTLDQLAGLTLPSRIWEDLALPMRVRDFSPALLDRLTASGEIVWVGAGAQPGGDGLVAFLPRDVIRDLAPPVRDFAPNELHRELLDRLADGGARFFADLTAPREIDPLTGHPAAGVSQQDVGEALWDLAWAGLVTNDTLAPLRARRAGSSRAGSPGPAGASAAPASARPSSMRRAALARAAGVARPGGGVPPTLAGRWSLVPRDDAPFPVVPPDTAPEGAPRASPAAPTASPSGEAALSREAQVAHRSAHLLDLHGLLVREVPGLEDVPGGFAAAYQVMRRLEEAGHVRRGYLVEGLGASQFALPEVVDRLRTEAATLEAHRDGGEQPRVHVLAATDPAQPYGAAVAWPALPGDVAAPTRSAGALVVLVESAPVLYLARGGRSLTSFPAPGGHLAAAVRALADLVVAGRVRTGMRAGLVLDKIGGAPALEANGPLADALRERGFRPSPRGWRLG